MRVALAQLSPVVGDFSGNVRRVLEAARHAAEAGCQVVVTPELALSGYPPRDLLDRPEFVDDGLAALGVLAAALPRIEAVVGFVDRVEGRPPLRNAVAVLRDGRVASVHHKRLLPTYDVFEEGRYFGSSDEVGPVLLAGARAGLTICEDIWGGQTRYGSGRYSEDPVATLAAAGAELIVNSSASPWRLGKERDREALVCDVARRSGVPVVYCNQVGGNDELLFDGRSVFVDAAGVVRARGAAFAEDLIVCDLAAPERSAPPGPPPEADEESLRLGLCMGIRDYVHRCGFVDVLLGLSGGIDSALVCALAAQALGPDHVLAVAMPSRHSSAGSLHDARALAENLGVRLVQRPIEGPYAAFSDVLAEDLAGRPPDVTEENLQARVRGTLLMALSNRRGALLLNTGNKSELAVGYCTLYGDMCGGLAVIGDVPKTLVYRLCRHLNARAGRDLVPQAILDKPPSAELRPGQLDQDSLPPYEVLDEVLDRFVVRGESRQAILQAGLPVADVDRVLALLQRSEYKRRQAPPALRVTSKAFGIGRRMPIASRRTTAQANGDQA